MIKQSAIGLDSRIEANPCNEHGFLPIITSPMNSVVDDKTYNSFLKNKIQVCLPRNCNPEPTGLASSVVYDNVVFESYSLNDFIKLFIKTDQGMRNGVDSQYTVTKVCIDTANGNMPKLHTAIYSAKKTYNNKLVIMAGNVSSIEAFIELAKTGVNYIRVGIGGGGACTTTVHTGVGQEDLEELIKKCNSCRKRHQQRFHFSIHEDLSKRTQLSKEDQEISFNIMTTSIVADGISSFIQQENLHRNGYAAINRLLHAGASLVMIGSIFAKSLDSAAEKLIKEGSSILKESEINNNLQEEWYTNPAWKKDQCIYAIYRGMSTREEQKTYRKPLVSVGVDLFDFSGKQAPKEIIKPQPVEWANMRPSEGKTITLPVEYTIKEWVRGCDDNRHDDFPGFVNALRSAMSYTGSKTLNEFKK